MGTIFQCLGAMDIVWQTYGLVWYRLKACLNLSKYTNSKQIPNDQQNAIS